MYITGVTRAQLIHSEILVLSLRKTLQYIVQAPSLDKIGANVQAFDGYTQDSVKVIAYITTVYDLNNTLDVLEISRTEFGTVFLHEASINGYYWGSTAVPSIKLSGAETATLMPTSFPSVLPSAEPSPLPSIKPTIKPTYIPTPAPTPHPTNEPTALPTKYPTMLPTAVPTVPMGMYMLDISTMVLIVFVGIFFVWVIFAPDYDSFSYPTTSSQRVAGELSMYIYRFADVVMQPFIYIYNFFARNSYESIAEEADQYWGRRRSSLNENIRMSRFMSP